MSKIGVTAGCLRALLAGDVLTHEVSKADVASKGLAHFCDCAKRAHEAGGITLRELNAAGFALQCAHVSNIQGSGAPASKSDIEWYNTHHGRAAHALCSGATCPSGLRPLSIPNGGGAHKVNRDTMLNWTQRVKEYLNDPIKPLADDAIVVNLGEMLQSITGNYYVANWSTRLAFSRATVLGASTGLIRPSAMTDVD